MVFLFFSPESKGESDSEEIFSSYFICDVEVYRQHIFCLRHGVFTERTGMRKDIERLFIREVFKTGAICLLIAFAVLAFRSLGYRYPPGAPQIYPDTYQIDYCFAQFAYAGDLVSRYYHENEEMPKWDVGGNFHAFMNAVRKPEERQDDPDGITGLSRFMSTLNNSPNDLMAMLAERVPLYVKKESELSSVEREQLIDLLPYVEFGTRPAFRPPFWIKDNPEIVVIVSTPGPKGHFILRMNVERCLEKGGRTYMRILSAMTDKTERYFFLYDNSSYLSIVVRDHYSEAR